MLINEKISIREFGEKSFQLRLFEPILEEKAILTHYLHNLDNGVSRYYKHSALQSLQDFVLNNRKGEGITIDNVITLLLAEVTNVPFPAPKDYGFLFIDLFAGIGGFRLALQNIGGKCIYSSEWDKDAQKTYHRNFGEIPFGDITQDEVKSYIPHNFDILCAGFPCQAFSIAGNQKGFSDTRGTLFFDIEEIIDKHRPKVVFLENVKNLISHDKGKTFKVIVEILEKKLGYRVFYDVLNSMVHANTPQNRERIFIVAFDPKQVKKYNKFEFPKEMKLTKTIHDFLDKEKQEDKYYYSEEHKYYPELDKVIKSRDTVYQWRRVYVRENKSNVCPTLTANMGTGGHNVPLIRDDFGIRKLTPNECFAFQGYPMSEYMLPEIANSKLYMQAGNTVTTSLVEKIAQQILKVL